MIKTIPNTCQVQIVRYYPEFSIICSIGHAPFYGTIEIEYQAADVLLEFESFETWLRSIAQTNETIESLCRLVFDQLTHALGAVSLIVTVNAETIVHGSASATIQR